VTGFAVVEQPLAARADELPAAAKTGQR